MAKFYQISPTTSLIVEPSSELDSKVDKVPGKGLSTKDFTKNYRNKVNAIAPGAEVNVNADWNATSGDAQILNKPIDITDLTLHSLTELPDYANIIADISGATLTVGPGLAYNYNPTGNIGYLENTGILAESDPVFSFSPAASITQTQINTWDAGALGGTVTSFSAGDLSPLFTTSEANPTTTPALSFSLTNAGANTYFGNATGSPTSPSYTSAAALTKVDDANVTLTLGGSPTTALLSAASLTLGWTGQLPVTRGGTGLNTVTQGNLIYASATDTFSRLAKNTSATRYLSNTGTSNNPAWAQVNLTNGVTGTLPGGSGGTGATSFGAVNRIPYASSTTVLTNSANLTFDGTSLSLTGRETITGTASYSADTNFLTITGTGTSTANGVDISGINSTITVANDGTPTSNSFRGATFGVTSNATLSGILYGTVLGGVNTSPNVTQFYGLNARIDENSATGSLSSRYGMDFLVVKGAQDATDAHSFTGIRTRIQDSTSTGRITTNVGLSIGVENGVSNTAAALTTANTKGTNNTQYGIQVATNTSGSGVNTANAYGIRLASTISGGATLTNYYGLFCDHALPATTNYFLYTTQNYRNYLNGSLALGVNDNGSKLFIRGTGATSSTYSIFAENSSGTDYFKLNDAGQLYLGASTPNAAAVLQADSTTQGFLPPRGTTAQKNAIASPPEGLCFYDTTTHKLCVYDGTVWQDCF